ncbi:MAG: DUF4340 domain-containing protein [Opitutus sp.]|nr:DUF4340 domain-containing protein [Opitutus sp.]
MRTKVTLVLVFLNVALFFFIFKFERNWQTEAASLETRRRVLGPEAANIRSLEISTTAGNVVSLVRNRDTWFLTKPLDWPANPHAVSSIVHELQLLEHETSFRVADLAKTNQALADYGLDKPKLTVAFSSRDPGAAPPATTPATLLRIGDMTKDGKRVYVLSPDGERIHVVGRTLIDSLSFPIEQLRADILLTIPVFEARSLTVHAVNPDQTRGGPTAGVRIRIRRDGARWTFETPIVARASKTAVDLAINDLNGLHAKTFSPPAPATLPSAAPALRVVLEGNNRHESLFLGEPVPVPAGAESKAPAGGVEYYAQLEGRSVVFTVVVPTGLLEVLRGAQESLREKRILDFDPRAVTAVTLASPVQAVAPLTLQRLDATAGAAPDAAPRWQIIQRGEGTQGPKPLPADRAVVQRLLEQLTLLSAEQFKSDAPTTADLEAWGFNRPEREITLTMASSATPVRLLLGTEASTPRTISARVGTPADPGASIYTVKIDFPRELPIAVNAWRDRSLREPLPQGAHFSALRVTDLESRQLVSDTTFNTAGEPAAPPRDPKAVQEVLTQLRTLRAKSILPGGFADKVTLTGDERPWRYQLDATLSLPAGSGGEQTSTVTLYLTERIGGTQQYGGARDLDVIFELEQPLLDALWALLYGARDPGPPPPPPKA